MSTQARLADRILQGKYGMNLYHWAMGKRYEVKPPGWDEVAEDLKRATDGEIQISGQMLRQWLLAMEEDLKAKAK